jgi:hypothetical protein
VSFSGHGDFIMKLTTLALTATVSAAFVVSSTAAFAQDRHTAHMTATHVTAHHTMSRGSRGATGYTGGGYRNYHGHRAYQRNGHWGYYQPRNGVNVWITVPL